MFKLKRIKTKSEWEEYRQMVLDTPLASFTLLPDWLDGYCLFPFLIKKHGFLIYDKNDILIGGIAGIRFWFARCITVYPSDPIFKEDLNKFEFKIEEILLRLFITTKGKIHISTKIENPFSLGLTKGKFPKGFYPNPGIGLVKIPRNHNQLLESFKPKVRRDIRLSERRGVNVNLIESRIRLKFIYDFLKNSSIINGYKIRPYVLFKKMWIKMLINNTGVFAEAKVGDVSKGIIWLIKSGRCLHYIMGATLKEDVELNVGYALQYWAIKYSQNLGFNSYNISIGGPSSVEKFKDDFGRENILISECYVGIF